MHGDAEHDKKNCVGRYSSLAVAFDWVRQNRAGTADGVFLQWKRNNEDKRYELTL